MIALPYLGPWCCEKGEQQGVVVCPECAETCAAYQSCLGIDPDRENKLNLPSN